MSIEKSLLTDSLLIVGLLICFVCSFVKRKNMLYSVLFAAAFFIIYQIFIENLLPFPLDLQTRGPLLDYGSQFILTLHFLSLDYIKNNLTSFILFILLGFTMFFLFQTQRHYNIALLTSLIITGGMLLFIFAVNMLTNGFYQMIDLNHLITFPISFSCGHFLAVLVSRYTKITAYIDHSN